jgi:hypothetical protein
MICSSASISSLACTMMRNSGLGQIGCDQGIAATTAPTFVALLLTSPPITMAADALLALFDAKAGELIGNVLLDGFCSIDIGPAAINIAVAYFGGAAAVERGRMFWIDLQRCIVI